MRATFAAMTHTWRPFNGRAQNDHDAELYARGELAPTRPAQDALLIVRPADQLDHVEARALPGYVPE
jgi:hypothetical protein